MHKRFRDNESRIVAVREVLTMDDFHAIESTRFCMAANPWPSAVVATQAAADAIKAFNVNIERYVFFYKRVLATRESLLRGIPRNVSQMAQEGFFTQYAIYITEEQAPVPVINVWPFLRSHSNHFEVPLRLEDLKLGKYMDTTGEQIR